MSKQLISKSKICLLVVAVAGILSLTVCENVAAENPFDRFVPRGRLLRKLRDDLSGQKDAPPAKPDNARKSQGKTPTPAVRPNQQATKQNQRQPQSQHAKQQARPTARPVPGFGMTVKVDKKENVFVTRVFPNGNAAEAGLRPGDVLVEAGGAKISSSEEYDEIAKVLGAGDQLEFKVSRRGKVNDVMVQFGQPKEATDSEAASVSTETAPGHAAGYQGNYSFVPAPANQSNNKGLQSVLTSAPQPSNRSATGNTVQNTVFQQQLEIQRLRRELQQTRRGGLTGSGLSLDGPGN